MTKFQPFPMSHHPRVSVSTLSNQSKVDNSVARYADLFAALGSESRLRIMQLLFRAYPQGMVVNNIKAELNIPNSTLSHHLEKLRTGQLVTVQKDRQYLWYIANAETMEDLLSFLYTGNSLTEGNTPDLVNNSSPEEKSMFEKFFIPIWDKLFISLGFPAPSRFTPQSINVIELARAEARRLGHSYVGTEQILVGLIAEKSGLAWQLLVETGLNLEAVQTELENILGRSSEPLPKHIPFTPRAKYILKIALQESRKLGVSQIDTEYLLLGLLKEGKGLGYKILTSLGVDCDRLEQRVGQFLG